MTNLVQAFFGQKGQERRNRSGGWNNTRGKGYAPSQAIQPRTMETSAWKFQQKHWTITIVRCQICGRTNHTAIKCYSEYDYAYQDEETPQALATMNLNSSDKFIYADSWATTHMINDMDKLTLAQSYTS